MRMDPKHCQQAPGDPGVDSGADAVQRRGRRLGDVAEARAEEVEERDGLRDLPAGTPTDSGAAGRLGFGACTSGSATGSVSRSVTRATVLSGTGRRESRTP